MRAVVHRTKGKLDLRSITVFGMNSKPETTTPIGYFGTGLKYAIAVLARNDIKVEITIDRKVWNVVKRAANFRDKGFYEIYLLNVGTLINREIKLPFTTELGKNWDLWQAFRELESNTRDENGKTYLVDSSQVEDSVLLKNHTIVTVFGEEYVEEFQTKDKTFLPGALTLMKNSGSVQVFKEPSQHVYYRGIRIMDLPEGQHSLHTYNILQTIKLTEDRTAAEPYWVRALIENHILQHKDPEVIKTVITAPNKTFESTLNYGWSSVKPSEEFLAATEEVDEDDEHLTYAAREIRDSHRPKIKPEYSGSWKAQLREAIKEGDWDKVQEVADEHREELIALLEEADNVGQNTEEAEEVQQEVQDDEVAQESKPVKDDLHDEIPF